MTDTDVMDSLEGMSKYLVVLDNGQSNIYWADHYIHAMEQSDNANPDNAVVGVYVLTLVYPYPAAAGRQ